mmetsp:Transcript_23735/g.58175  ORF Transcript_23735/g.58175 Transcript_23735/m.58175 type:complete len:190 (+) Transcript_23735:47-616(+)
MGHYDQDRLAYSSYAQTGVSQQEAAFVIDPPQTIINNSHAQVEDESQLYYHQRQELLEAQQILEEERQQRIRHGQRRIEPFETSFLSQQQQQQQQGGVDLEHLYLGEGRPAKNPFDIFKNWRACFGKLFQATHQDCEIDSDDEDCLNNPPSCPPSCPPHPCQPNSTARRRHLFVYSDIREQEEEEYYYR